MFEGFGASASRAQEGADLQAQLAQLQAAKSKSSAAGQSRADQVGRWAMWHCRGPGEGMEPCVLSF
jgi:hypothetical protein